MWAMPQKYIGITKHDNETSNPNKTRIIHNVQLGVGNQTKIENQNKEIKIKRNPSRNRNPISTLNNV